MIKNIDNIVAQNIGDMEWILKEFAKQALLRKMGNLQLSPIIFLCLGTSWICNSTF